MNHGRYNENRYIRFPFTEDAQLLTADGRPIPTSLLVDADVTFYAGEPGQVALTCITIGDASDPIVVLRIELAGAGHVDIEIPTTAEIPYAANMETETGQVTLVIGPGLADISAWPAGAYVASVAIEPTCCAFLARSRVTSVSGDYASSAVHGDVFLENGYNVQVRLNQQTNSVIYSASYGAGRGVNCAPVVTPSALSLTFTDQPSPGDTFVFAGYTYTFVTPGEHDGDRNISILFDVYTTYAELIDRLVDDFPSCAAGGETEGVPNRVTIIGPTALVIDSDFTDVEFVVATFYGAARDTCESALLQLNGARADSTGNITIGSSEGYVVTPDPDGHRIVFTLAHDTNELLCGVCRKERE